MEAYEITGNDTEGFLQFLGEDLADDLRRIYHRGIGVTDSTGKPVGAMVCELLNEDRSEETGCRIRFLKTENKEVFDAVYAYFQEKLVLDERVSESVYELAEKKEAVALSGVGFSKEKKESDSLIVTLAQLAESRLGKMNKPPAYIDRLGGLSVVQYRDALKQILFKGHNGVMEDISYLPMSWFDAEVSSCVVSGERVPGLFLIRKTLSGMLIPVLYFSHGPGYKRNLTHMLKYAFHKAMQCYPPETPVMIMRKNEHIRALSDWLLPGQKGAEVYYGMRKEPK